MPTVLGMPWEGVDVEAAAGVLASSSCSGHQSSSDIRKEWCPECLSLVKSRQIDHVRPRRVGLPPAPVDGRPPAPPPSPTSCNDAAAEAPRRPSGAPLLTKAAPWGSKPRQTLPIRLHRLRRYLRRRCRLPLVLVGRVHSPRHQPQRHVPRHVGCRRRTRHLVTGAVVVVGLTAALLIRFLTPTGAVLLTVAIGTLLGNGMP